MTEPGARAQVADLAARFARHQGAAIAATDLAAYASHLPQDAGTVLVAGTHGGRLLVELLALGYQVHGVEATPAQVVEAEATLREGGRDAPLFRQDLAALNLAFRYAGVLIGAQVLQSVRRTEAPGAIRRAKAHLVDPGVLLLELEVPAEAEHPPGAPLVEIERIQLDDGSIITRRCERLVDAQAHRIDIAQRYELRCGVAVTAREDARVTMEWYEESEAEALLAEAGFAKVAVEMLAPPAHDAHARRYLVRGSLA